MELCLKYNNINKEEIIYDSIEPNKVIQNGYFIKLSYHNFYNINIISNTLTLNNPIKYIYNTKRRINLKYMFISNNETNQKFIEFTKKYDKFFEEKTRTYLTSKNIRNKNLSYVGMMRKTENNGILFRIPIHDNEHEFNNTNNNYKLVFRWNGIWISNSQFGLNYKILLVIPTQKENNNQNNIMFDINHLDIEL